MITCGKVNLMAMQGVGEPYEYVRFKQDHHGYYLRPLQVLSKGKVLDCWKGLADWLKSCTDPVIFTYNIEQYENFKKDLEERDLSKYIVLDTGLVRNPNYPTNGPRVGTIILKGVKE